MHPVDEYAGLKDQIKALEARVLELRAGFLIPNARLRSNQTEVVIRQLTRRVFQKDRLPPEILNNPRYWEETSNPSVVVNALITKENTPPHPEPVLIEPF